MTTQNYEPQTIRSQCVEHSHALLEQAITTLTAKGCTVYTANDTAEAAEIIRNLCADNAKALCTFSSELEEIGLKEIVPQAMQTDLEKIAADGLGRRYVNPRRAPLDNASQDEISNILNSFLTEPAEGSLLHALSRQIKVAADKADWGITGLDGIAADTGTIILAEDQGNGRIVSNIPARHLAVAGLEKLYPSNDTALESIHAAWKADGRNRAPVYYSYITGPSRTGDIEGAMVCGMHGPLAVHVILLDNGRSALIEENKGAVLKCMECGQCSAALEELTSGLDKPLPAPLTCKSLALADKKHSYTISEDAWDTLHFQCPVAITPEDLKQAMSKA